MSLFFVCAQNVLETLHALVFKTSRSNDDHTVDKMIYIEEK